MMGESGGDGLESKWQEVVVIETAASLREGWVAVQFSFTLGWV